MHALRLGLQGIEYMTARRIPMPVDEPHLATLRAIRAGEVPYADVLALIAEAEAALRRHVDTCEAVADEQRIVDFMVWAHRASWG